MSRSGKLSNLLSMWEKKAEESNNSSNVQPKRNPIVFKKQTSLENTKVPTTVSSQNSQIIHDPKEIENETVQSNHTIPYENTEIVDEAIDPSTNSVIEEPEGEKSTLDETQVETTIVEEEESIISSDSHQESSTVESHNSINEESSQIVDETLPQQEETLSSSLPQNQETIEEQIPSAPELPEETNSDSNTTEEITTQGLFKVTISEFKAIVSCSVMASSLEPLQNQLDFLLQQNKCTRREELSDSARSVFDTIKSTVDVYMSNVFTVTTILSSVLQQISITGTINPEIRLIIGVLMRHVDLIEMETSNMYTFFSLFVQMAFGTADKIEILISILRDENVKRLISKNAILPNYKLVFGSVYPAIAKNDFKLFMESYADVYFQSGFASTQNASYCCQIYKEVCNHPEHVERFINEAIMSLSDFSKIKNEPMEKLFCNSLYNMVKSCPDKYFNSERYEIYEKTLLACKEELFESNRVYIDEMFDLKKSLVNENEDEQSSEDLILIVEYNGKKKKNKESGGITFAQLISSILEKFQIQEEHQSMNDLFDKGIIVEYFEESINDWVEFERIEDIPRSPKVGKIRIIKEEIQANQISQIIERNTNIQLVNDKYQILKRIGKGGFGSVYSANAYSSSDTKPSLCALKYIEIDSIINFNRSMREGIQMLQLDHPNIARISDVFEVQSSDIGIMGVETKRYLCFAMPLYSHGDLYELVKNQSHIITGKLLGSIMKQLMDSLTYLHDEYSIVHRDIKPQNVLIESIDLVNKTLKPILSDFGLAKTLLKTETQVAGTASYMSPEMSSRRGYNLSTDIWSMGVMFYQLLSFDFITDVKGKVQDNEFDFLTKQIERTWTGQDLEISSTLKKITFDMLSLNPEARPTARQVFESLSSF